MHYRLLLLTLCLTVSTVTFSQKQIVNQYNGWYMYFGNHKLTEKVSLHTEYQLRRADIITSRQQSLYRIGVDYKVKDALMITGGYAYIVTWPYGEQPVAEKFREHRLWEQLVMTQRSGRFYFNHRYRIEQRWMEGNGGSGAEGYTYRNRIRYRFLVNVPLNKKEISAGTLFLSASDEIFIQAGKNFQRNYLEQNRLYVTLAYQFSSKGNVQLGYLNHFLIKGDGLSAERNHTLQVSLTYNADLRRKGTGPLSH